MGLPSLKATLINKINKAKNLSDKKLRAEAPVVEVVIKPFPIDRQPASFNGALGKLDVVLTPPSQTAVQLGDSIFLNLAVKGAANLDDLRLPDLLCQPGFSGFFQIPNISSSLREKEKVKQFTVELKPVSHFSVEIPSIELSSFDSKTNSYPIWRSESIPLTLQIAPSPSSQQETAQTHAFAIDLNDVNAFLDKIKPAGSSTHRTRSIF